MIHIKEAIIVEGKYDKETLRKFTDAPIICTHGFSLYRSKNIMDSIRHFATTCGVIILTDSDRAGFRIRNYIKTCLGKNCNIKNAYIPPIPGKEKRKDSASKDGLLGVEGMSEEILTSILNQAATMCDAETVVPVIKKDFYADGLTGKPDSLNRRKKLANALHLPSNISANALLELINQIGGFPVYRDAMIEISEIKN